MVSVEQYLWRIRSRLSGMYSLSCTPKEVFCCVKHVLLCKQKASKLCFASTVTAFSAITLHGVLRLLPILDQLKEGFRLYGLAELLNQYPEICRPLFVAGEAIEVSPYE